jgi:hypothetical protein
MFWGCITYHEIGTFTEIEGTINPRKYIDALDMNLWPVIARHIPNDDYFFEDGNAPINTLNEIKLWKQENNVKCMNWPSQLPDINVIDNSNPVAERNK